MYGPVNVLSLHREGTLQDIRIIAASSLICNEPISSAHQTSTLSTICPCTSQTGDVLNLPLNLQFRGKEAIVKRESRKEKSHTSLPEPLVFDCNPESLDQKQLTYLDEIPCLQAVKYLRLRRASSVVPGRKEDLAY
jgi:hypothetical protein